MALGFPVRAQEANVKFIFATDNAFLYKIYELSPKYHTASVSLEIIWIISNQ